jgi:trans-2-enoyl-CoA reductase
MISPMVRNNICLNAPHRGCAKEVLRQISFIKAKKPLDGVPKRYW